MIEVTAQSLYLQQRDTVPIAQEARYSPGPVGMGAENIAIIGIRSSDRPAYSEDVTSKHFKL